MSISRVISIRDGVSREHALQMRVRLADPFSVRGDAEQVLGDDRAEQLDIGQGRGRPGRPCLENTNARMIRSSRWTYSVVRRVFSSVFTSREYLFPPLINSVHAGHAGHAGSGYPGASQTNRLGLTHLGVHRRGDPCIQSPVGKETSVSMRAANSALGVARDTFKTIDIGTTN